MLVVLDTNVFVHELHLLRSGVGPLFLHFLAAKGGKLFIPGILKREYSEQALCVVQNAQKEITSKLTRIEAIVGVASGTTLPTPYEVQAAVKARLAELAPVALHSDLNDVLVLAAANRTFDGRAPSSKTDHGLKDCVIWESILTLPKGSEVHLVTHDKGFYEGAELAQALKTESEAQQIRVVAHNAVGDVLKDLQDGTPALDVARVSAALDAALLSRIVALEKQWDLMPLDRQVKNELVPYYTERVNRVFVTFTREYLAIDVLIGDISYATWRAAISGSFVWRTDDLQLEDLRVEREELLDQERKILRNNVTVYPELPTLRVTQTSPYKIRGRLTKDSR
jgi:hypothetical protein